MVGEIRNGRAGGEARALSTPCSWANTSISDRSSSVDYRSFLTTETPIPPPAEKFENRPLGPTTSIPLNQQVSYALVCEALAI